MTGYLIVIKIPWNYGKLIFHASSDYSPSNNTTALACPLGFFGFSWLRDTSAAVVFPPGMPGPRLCYQSEHPPSVWLLLCPPCHPPLGPGMGIGMGTWTPFRACNRAGYTGRVKLSSRGAADPPGRFLRSSAVPRRRSHAAVNPLLETAPPGMRLNASVELLVFWYVNSNAEE